MSLQKIKFGDKEVDKKEFYSSKHAILLDSVDLSKIVVSNKWKINDATCKYLCGYLDNDVVRPLSVILPQMSGYIKYFDDGAKKMSFMEIWNVIKKLLKLKLTVNPVRDNKYMLAKSKLFNGINKTIFTDDVVPMEKNHYIFIPAIDIDSVLKVDQRVYPQAYLE